jgi:hypothetical protein
MYVFAHVADEVYVYYDNDLIGHACPLPAGGWIASVTGGPRQRFDGRVEALAWIKQAG